MLGVCGGDDMLSLCRRWPLRGHDTATPLIEIQLVEQPLVDLFHFCGLSLGLKQILAKLLHVYLQLLDVLLS